MKKPDLTVIGHFGGTETFNDGQTVKTKNLVKELRLAGLKNIKIVDTYYKKKNPLKLLVQTIYALFYSKNIIILLSTNGLRFFLPLLYYGKKVSKVRIFHDVIGGRLGEYIDKNPSFKKYLNSFDLNIVETVLLKDELIQRGIVNVEIIPNFRRMDPIDISKVKADDYSIPFKFCTFSRVIKEKGIGDAIEAIEAINTKNKSNLCQLDIYGPIAKEYQVEFQQLLEESSEMINYVGEVSSDEAVEVLKNYYGVLFPTYWPSESNAGTISESFFAGVPVIATDWRCNAEMIKDGIDGIIYPGNYAQNLVDGIDWLISKNADIIDIKRSCIEAADYYQPEKHIARLVKLLNVK